MAKSGGIHLVVVTPERSVADETVESVVIPAHDGEIGILAERAPLMCELGIGELRFRQGNRTQHVFIDGGFAQVLKNEVTVLTAHAMKGDEITRESVAAADEKVKSAGTPATAERTKAYRRANELRRIYDKMHDPRIPIPT